MRLALLLMILLVVMVSGTATAQQPTEPITGLATDTIIAHYHPDLPVVCAIRADETLLAIGRVDDMLRVYTGGLECEGPVWIDRDSAVTWAAGSRLTSLPQLQLTATTGVIDDLPEYETICQSSTSAAPAEVSLRELQTVYLPGSWSFFPPDFVAFNERGVDVVICLKTEELSQGICPDVRTRVELIQEQLTVTLMHYPTQTRLNERVFSGNTPECPSTADADLTLRGGPPTRDEWVSWVLGQMTGTASGSLRTTTAVNRLNARAEANTRSEILEILSFGTPVNLIARDDDGEWVVALLPDMSKAWLSAELLTIAAQIDIETLPVADGPATEVSIRLR